MPPLLRVLSWLRTDSRFGDKEFLWCSRRLPGRGRQQRDPGRQTHGTQTAGLPTPKAARSRGAQPAPLLFSDSSG